MGHFIYTIYTIYTVFGDFVEKRTIDCLAFHTNEHKRLTYYSKINSGIIKGNSCRRSFDVVYKQGARLYKQGPCL